MRGLLWIEETKTSAAKQRIWWDKFVMDFQTSAYIYGVWKATGIRPHGVLVCKYQKPNSNQGVDATEIFHEPYLRTEADLERFEKQFTLACNEMEGAMLHEDTLRMNTESCIAWNRRCDYFNLCHTHGSDKANLIPGNPDYVDLEYYKQLGLDIPPDLQPKEEDINGDEA